MPSWHLTTTPRRLEARSAMGADSPAGKCYQGGRKRPRRAAQNKITGGRPTMLRTIGLCSLGLSASLFPAAASAQALPPLSVCNTEPKAAACSAVRGDRSEGWKLQTRAEVMAQHGI